MKYIVGIDLGGTTAKIGIVSDHGMLQHKLEVPTDTTDAGRNIIPNLANAITNACAQQNIAWADVEGVGFSVPGAVVRNSYVHPCVNLNHWGGFEAGTAFSETIHKPVVLINDANAAAMGEFWQGGAKSYQNMIFLTLGTGVGGGIIVNGKLLDGPHGCAGEIGHIHVKDHETRTCGCGQHGCLEQYCSATGIVACAKQALLEYPSATVLKDNPDFSCRDIFDAARNHDPLASQLVSDYCSTLGQALASLACVCDTDVFVLGGGVSKAGAILLDGVKAAYEATCFPALHGVNIKLAELGNDAGIYGAAKLLIDQL